MQNAAALRSNILKLPVKPLPKPATRSKSRLARRKDGRFAVSVSFTLSNGEKRRRFFYGNTQAEAKAKRDAFRNDVRAGMNTDWLDMSFRDYADHWLDMRRFRVKDSPAYKNTLRAYERYADMACGTIGCKRVRGVTMSDMQLIANSMAAKSSSYIAKASSVFKGIFESARNDRIITFNPVSGVVFPKGAKGTHRALDSDEIIRVRTRRADHPFYLPVMLMLFAGLRRGELLGLKWSDIVLDEDTIKVRRAVYYTSNQPGVGKPKTDAGTRDIPILKPLRDILPKDIPESGFVVGGGSSPVTLSKFNRLWRSFRHAHERELNGLRSNTPTKTQRERWISLDIRPHDLRHTFCTFLYDAGVDVKTAQAWMGHSDVKVTMGIYTHLSQTRKVTSLDSLTRYFSAF